MKHIYILIGNYGSGKTELALNFALESAYNGKSTLLVDLDMNNPYFRLSEKKELVESCGIRLITPNFVSTGVEALSLPAEVSSAFDMDWDAVIFDVAGDGTGATILGRYKHNFSALAPEQLEVLNVVNLRRPLSGSVERIIALTTELERCSRLKITGFINNTNLAVETGEDELRDGYFALREASEKTGVPVMYTTGKKEYLEIFLSEGYDPQFIGDPKEIKTYMRRS